jgi:FtsH-binding integral membrane protein
MKAMKDYTKRVQRADGFAPAAETQYDQGLRAYLLNVFNYMGGGLALTGIVAYVTAHTPALLHAIYGTPLMWLVMLAPLGFVIFFSARIRQMSYSAAQMTYWLFAAVMGLSMATIFIAYTGTSIARTFFVTAGVFGAMSLYGHSTKKDLSGIGNFLFMGLIGIILASLVNIFMKSSGLDFAVSLLGVLIFTGLTAVDVQRIKRTYYAIDGDMVGKLSIYGALQLYLDFINLFMMLLRFTGDRR